METKTNKPFDFSSVTDEARRKEYIKSVILDAVLFSEFKNTLNDVELIYLSVNPSLTTAMIKGLFEKSLDNVSINLLKNVRCPHDKIDAFLKHNDKIYNISIAHNTALKKEHYYQLFQQLDLDVNISLAFNPNCPTEIIKELALLHNKLIDQAICSNPNTPIDVLQHFLYDSEMKSCLTKNATFKSYVKSI